MKNNGTSAHAKAAEDKPSAADSFNKGVADPKFCILNSSILIRGN